MEEHGAKVLRRTHLNAAFTARRATGRACASLHELADRLRDSKYGPYGLYDAPPVPALADVDLSLMRCFRLLRPLRTLNKFPGLRMIVATIMMSVPRLGDLMVLAVFARIVFKGMIIVVGLKVDLPFLSRLISLGKAIMIMLNLNFYLK